MLLPTLANFARTRNNDKIDIRAKTVQPGSTGFPVFTGEAKFRNRNIGSEIVLSILERIPEDSMCHIALVTKLISSDVKVSTGTFASFAKKNGLTKSLIIGMRVTADGEAELFRISGLSYRKRRKPSHNRIVIFFECPDSDELAVDDLNEPLQTYTRFDLSRIVLPK